ncbi:MAG: SEC-C metal-binding domain-containing protein [Spirochaetota bacterium]
MNKVGRNEPCPCGSGKKYKHCCLKNDNIIPFPAQKSIENSIEHYGELVAKWDTRNGPVPTLMESLGMPNPSTEVLNKMKNEMEKHEFNDINEAQAFMEKEMNAANSKIQDDFLGLSSTQMRSVLRNNFSENPIVHFRDEIEENLIKETPVYRQFEYIINALAESEKGIKATQKGNFPQKLVQEFYKKFIKDDSIYEINPRMEAEVKEIEAMRFFFTNSGLMKKKHNIFTITAKGLKLYKNSNIYENYKMLFHYYATSYNWLYLTRYPESFGFMQQSYVFNLHLIRKKAAGFITGVELAQAYGLAFPYILHELSDEEDKQSIVESGFSYLFLNNFALYFGLVEKKTEGREIFSRNHFYRTTKFFEKLFEWTV